MPIIQIHPVNPQERLISKAAQILDKGGVIAYPSDTSYALAADIFNKKAVEKLYNIKKTDKSQLFSCICYDYAKISEYAFVSTKIYRIMNHHLPGPYTFILKGKSLLPKLTLSKRKTIGIRMPDSNIVKALYVAAAHPFLSCGIRLGTDDILNDPETIEERIGHAIDCVIDGGSVPHAPSSVVSLESDIPVILREGSGNLSNLRA